MPELPEVETLCRQLHKKIAGKIIADAEVYDSKLAYGKSLRGKTVVAVRRRGKMVEIVLNDGYAVLIHLRMTGRLLWQKDIARTKHSRWRMSFSTGDIFLVDPRRFATIKIAKDKGEEAGNDIFRGFNSAEFIGRHGKRKAKVKNIIMDQNAIAGIGNIYACEILHRSCISPVRSAAGLKKNEWGKIFANAQKILSKAIEKRGTSISDWRDLYGRKGENQNELKAYGQEGKRCGNCGGIIKRIKQGGRSTFYCPQCQK